MEAKNKEAVMELLTTGNLPRLKQCSEILFTDERVELKIADVLIGGKNFEALRLVRDNVEMSQTSAGELLVAAMIVAHPESADAFLKSFLRNIRCLKGIKDDTASLLLHMLIMGVCRAVTVLGRLDKTMPGLSKDEVNEHLVAAVSSPQLKGFSKWLQTEESALVSSFVKTYLESDPVCLRRFLKELRKGYETRSGISMAAEELVDNFCHKIFGTLDVWEKLIVLDKTAGIFDQSAPAPQTA